MQKKKTNVLLIFTTTTTKDLPEINAKVFRLEKKQQTKKTFRLETYFRQIRKT